MSSTTKAEAEEDIAEVLECGTSLAEDVWAVPSITVPSLSPLCVVEKNSAAASVAVEEAWSKINQLRSRLADDVIGDPPSSSSSSAAILLSSNGSDSSNSLHHFSTFVSPFEEPQSIKSEVGGDTTKCNNDKNSNTASSSSSSSYKGMSIPLIYCDQTASQRPVRSIEDYIRCISMPCYANTHTVSRDYQLS